MAFPSRKPGKSTRSGPAKAGLKAKPRAKAKPARPRRPSTVGTRKRGTSVKHTCGHKEPHALTGPAWKKAKDIAWQKTQLCTSCWSLAKAEEQEALCGIPDLPDLEGAARQVSWARSLRAEVLAKVKVEAWRMDQERKLKGLEPATDRYLGRVLPLLLARTEASWWIDNRESDYLELALDFDTQDALEALRQEASKAIICPF